MDIGRIIVCAIIIVVLGKKYINEKKVWYPLVMFLALIGGIYTGAYNIYQFLNPAIQVTLNLVTTIAILTLIIYMVKKRKELLNLIIGHQS